jgi:hypothetical protein
MGLSTPTPWATRVEPDPIQRVLETAAMSDLVPPLRKVAATAALLTLAFFAFAQKGMAQG